MRIPEPLFKLVNFIVKALLASPLHSLASGSFMVIQRSRCVWWVRFDGIMPAL